MFCINCGKEINDNQKFCRYCGAKNEIGNVSVSSSDEIANSAQSQQMNTIFNRDVLNNYLYNVRLMEIAKKKLYKQRNNLNHMINSLGHKKIGYMSWSLGNELYEMKSGWVLLLFPMLIEIAILFIARWLGDNGTTSLIMILLIIATVAFGIVLTMCTWISDAIKVKEHNKKAKQDEIRVRDELCKKAPLEKKVVKVNKEIERLENLCAEAYSVNIIPSKYRNIHAIYFLYDFISTSTASLNEALLHCDLDTIQEKLDTVIQQQEDIIMELAYQNALNEKIVRQNEQILGHAIQTENNTALAAQYTRIAANNTNIVAAIQMSEYLRP